MHEVRLGDEIDDFCIKCKRLTNHAVVSLLNGAAAKVRCRTCYHDHDFRNGEPMPSKKDLKKAQLLEQVLAGAGSPVADSGTAAVAAPVEVEEPKAAEAVAMTATATVTPAATKKARKGAKG